jgi:hypothetical protein
MSDEKGYDMARSWLDLRARADGATPGNLCKECWRWITAHTPPRGTEMKSDTAL